LGLKRIIDLTKEEAIDTLLRMTQDNIIHQGNIVVLDDVITEDECRWILDEIQNNPIPKESVSANGYGHNVRNGDSYKISWLPNVDSFVYDRVASKIHEVLRENYYYSISIDNYGVIDLGYEYCHYREGQSLVRHSDGRLLHIPYERDFLNTGKDTPYLPYVVASMSLMLNTIEKGAELVFPNQQAEIQQKAGRVVIWSPDPQYQHLSNPVPPNEERHVIVTWYALKDIVAVRSSDL